MFELENLKTYRVLGVDFTGNNYEQVSDIIIREAKSNHSYSVFALPVHGIITAITNSKMALAIKKANVICPDGQPVRWSINILYNARLKDRVAGPILTLKVLEKCNQEGLKVFLYGGATEQILVKFIEFIKKKYPEVQICGSYREDKPIENTISAEQINSSGANLVLVGRGCPRQEIWISENIGKVNSVMMAVGAAFSFHAGAIKKAPNWMQRCGLEWLHRLSQEPSRLWKRYLVTNTLFIFLIFLEIIKSRMRIGQYRKRE